MGLSLYLLNFQTEQDYIKKKPTDRAIGHQNRKFVVPGLQLFEPKFEAFCPRLKP
jgi:hypothetical protein